MQYTVYILYSRKLDKFYVGYSSNISRRFVQHNSRMSAYTSTGIPWRLLWCCSKNSKLAAECLELKIKNLTRFRKVKFMLNYADGCLNTEVIQFLDNRNWY
jgi:putative endonuclease